LARAHDIRLSAARKAGVERAPMAANDYDFTDSALIGHLVSVTLLAKLVDRGLVSPDDAADVLDDCLLQLEEWQAAFPEYQRAFEIARDFLSKSLDGYRAMPKRQPD
jgi:hypothetical protein